MKTKGISFFEQHVEKLVLSAVVLVALALAAMQFLFQGNTVEIDGRDLAAAEVDDALAEKARAIKGHLGDTAEASVHPPQVPAVDQEFIAALDGPTSPERLAGHPTLRPHIEGAEARPIDRLFVVPALDATGTPFVDQHADALVARDVLPEGVVGAVQFGSADTNDLSWTTPTALLDLEALRQQLAATDPDGQRMTIFPSWYHNRISILDVVFERETLMPDGSWGELTVVPTMPGLIEHRQRVNGNPAFTTSGMRALLDWLREEPGLNQASIIQPDFYETKSSTWFAPQPPDEQLEETNEIIQGIYQLKNELDLYQARYDRITAELDELGGPLEEEENRQGGGDTGGGTGGRGRGGGGGGPDIPGGGGGAGGGRGQGIGDDGQDEANEATNRRRSRLTRQLHQLQGYIESMRSELDERAAAHGVVFEEQAEDRAIPDLQRDATVLVWSHDVTVERGRTYRYRATVKLYNPFWGKQSVLLEEQRPLASSAALDVKTSEWSEPVTIKPLTRFFVTSAKADDIMLGMGEATFDIFRLYDGIWHRNQFDLHPGDPVGETKRTGNLTIDYFADAFVQDILRTPSEQRANPNMPGGTPNSKVVVLFEDGSSIIRDPERDAASAEYLKLLTFTESERTAAAR